MPFDPKNTVSFRAIMVSLKPSVHKFQINMHSVRSFLLSKAEIEAVNT